MGLTSSSHMASHVLLWGTESSLSFSKTGAVLHDLAHSLKNGHPFSKACNKPFQLISYLLGSRCFPGSIWKSTQKWLCEILDLTIFILFFLSFRLSFARSSFFPILCQKLTRCLCIWHHIFFFFSPCLNLEGWNGADRLRSKEGELSGEVNMEENSPARCCQSCAPVRTADVYY